MKFSRVSIVRRALLALSIAAAAGPQAMSAQTFNTTGGPYSFQWTIGQSAANKIYIDIINTSAPGANIGAFAIWLPGSALSPTSLTVTGGTLSGSAAYTQWIVKDEIPPDIASNWLGGQFGDITGFDFSAGLSTSGNSNALSSVAAANALYTSPPVRFEYTFATSVTYSAVGAYAGLRGQGATAGSWSCGTKAGGAQVNPTESCSTIPSSTVPEPSAYALMATGLAGLVGVARRRRQA